MAANRLGLCCCLVVIPSCYTVCIQVSQNITFEIFANQDTCTKIRRKNSPCVAVTQLDEAVAAEPDELKASLS